MASESQPWLKDDDFPLKRIFFNSLTDYVFNNFSVVVRVENRMKGTVLKVKNVRIYCPKPTRKALDSNQSFKKIKYARNSSTN